MMPYYNIVQEGRHNKGTREEQNNGQANERRSVIIYHVCVKQGEFYRISHVLN
jgi:hypothetical protein